MQRHATTAGDELAAVDGCMQHAPHVVAVPPPLSWSALAGGALRLSTATTVPAPPPGPEPAKRFMLECPGAMKLRCPLTLRRLRKAHQLERGLAWPEPMPNTCAHVHAGAARVKVDSAGGGMLADLDNMDH